MGCGVAGELQAMLNVGFLQSSSGSVVVIIVVIHRHHLCGHDDAQRVVL